MKIDIENFAEEQGEKISNAVLLRYTEYPYLLGKNKTQKSFWGDVVKGYKEAREEKKMEKEIQDRAFHEATVFFLQNSDLKFDTEIKNILVQHLSQKVKNPSALKKLTPKELLGSEIQNYAVDFLLQNNVFVFENNV
jgi:hypothetical protein